VDNLTSPSVETAGFFDADAHAAANLSWAGQISVPTAFEINYYNGSQFIEDILSGGSMAVTFVPTATEVVTVEQVDATSAPG
jgi:hypothetical protein